MKHRLSIDRFEGDAKGIAVLLADDGTPVNFPRALLPKGSKPGDVLSFTIVLDDATTRRVAARTRQVQDELKAGDTGGDIKL